MQFEKDAADPFNIDEMIRDVTGGAGGAGSAGNEAGKKRYGVQETSQGPSKRARIDDEYDGPT